MQKLIYKLPKRFLNCKWLIQTLSYFIKKLLIQHGDIKSNPGPSKKHRPLACCNQNINNLTAPKMLRKSSTEAYNINNKYDFICISKTYLDSTIAADYKDLVTLSVQTILTISKRQHIHFYKESLVIQLIKVD